MTKYRVIFEVEERDLEAVRTWARRVDKAQADFRFVEAQRQAVWWSTVDIDVDRAASFLYVDADTEAP